MNQQIFVEKVLNGSRILRIVFQNTIGVLIIHMPICTVGPYICIQTSSKSSSTLFCPFFLFSWGCLLLYSWNLILSCWPPLLKPSSSEIDPLPHTPEWTCLAHNCPEVLLMPFLLPGHLHLSYFTFSSIVHPLGWNKLFLGTLHFLPLF